MPTATPVLPAWQRTSSAAENTNEKGAAPENTNQKEAASSSAGDSPEITFSANQVPGESEQLDLTDQSEAMNDTSENSEVLASKTNSSETDKVDLEMGNAQMAASALENGASTDAGNEATVANTNTHDDADSD